VIHPVQSPSVRTERVVDKDGKTGANAYRLKWRYPHAESPSVVWIIGIRLTRAARGEVYLERPLGIELQG